MASHYIFYLFFSPIVIISIIFLILKLVRIMVWCNCEICQTYIESRWSLQFVNLCDWYSHLLKQSPSRTIHIHVLNNVITANPRTVEYMLKTRFDNFPKGKPFSAILGDFLGRGIFNVDGDAWRFQRKMAGLELARLPIRAFAFDIVRQVTERRLIPVMDSVSNGKDVLDLQDVFKRFSFDCICRFSFGLDPKCLELKLPLSEFAVSFDLASKLSAERAMTASPLVWKMKRLMNIGSERKLRRSIAKIDVLAREVIRQRRRLGSSDENDLLSRFMACTHDESYLRDIVINFMLAGRDTVASALTSFFWLVARHPEVEAAIIDEADEVIGKDYMGVRSYEQLKELHYLHGAVYESMRLFPPVQFDSKFCLNDDVLPDGKFVKGGTRVTYHAYAMGRMEEIWGLDCLEFKPERWLTDGVFCLENNFKYPVFHAGPRVCLGKEMALIELKCVAISLLRLFRVELIQFDVTTPRFSPGLTATYRDGLRVIVRDRCRDQTSK